MEKATKRARLQGVVRQKCIVFGCSNHKDEGDFVGDLCAPCHKYLTTGKIGPTDSFLGLMRNAVISLNNSIA